MANPKSNKKQILSWAFYDFANSAFATTVMAAFFPVFFKEFWSQGVEVGQSTFYLGVGNSAAGLVLALSAPILGAIADKGGTRKLFLFIFTLFGILATASFYYIPQGEWLFAIIFYVLASIGFFGANIFYDSLLLPVSQGKKMDYVSGLGYSLGYLGGSILLSINVLMTLKPQWFGLANASAGVRLSFLTVAVWWFIFSFPLFFNVHEKTKAKKRHYLKAINDGFTQINETFHKLKKMKAVFVFLLAYLFYIDGVNTMIKMAVDYGMSLGFESKNLIAALLITNFVAFPSAIAFGYLGEKKGARFGIYLALIIYICVTIFGHFMQNVDHFYILAGAIGLVQGGIQALSRSYYASMIPEEQSAEFFGFFNMLGKFSSFLGPILVGWVSLKTNSPRHSILVILLFFLVGAGLLYWHGTIKKSENHSS